MSRDENNRLREFMDSYIYWTVRTEIKRYRELGAVRLWIVRSRFSIVLKKLSVPKRLQGCGLASDVLKYICVLADRHGVPITGYAKPFGEKRLNCAQLKSWYRRHGFRISREGLMRRDPR